MVVGPVLRTVNGPTDVELRSLSMNSTGVWNTGVVDCQLGYEELRREMYSSTHDVWKYLVSCKYWDLG